MSGNIESYEKFPQEHCRTQSESGDVLSSLCEACINQTLLNQNISFNFNFAISPLWFLKLLFILTLS